MGLGPVITVRPDRVGSIGQGPALGDSVEIRIYVVFRVPRNNGVSGRSRSLHGTSHIFFRRAFFQLLTVLCVDICFWLSRIVICEC